MGRVFSEGVYWWGNFILSKKFMKKLKKDLENYILKNPYEKEVAEKFINFLEKYWEKWFFRENLEWHFTWSVLVFNKDFSKTLLMHHKKLNRWLNFWWHADWDLNIKNVAIKELWEEAWILMKKEDLIEDFMDLDLQIIPERKKEPEHFHYDIRFVICVNENILFEKQDLEVNEIKWFNVLDLVWNNDFDSLFRVVNKIRK